MPGQFGGTSFPSMVRILDPDYVVGSSERQMC
uniref:Uncharacterized protein n=1 Tax=Rhizophora mucronata TaxID=61149 RepID=A0A2P2N094_RHIMU